MIPGDAGLFASIVHEHRPNYWFLFHSERLVMTWVMSSRELIEHSDQMKRGKNIGKRTIWFNGKRKNKATGALDEHCYPRYKQFIANDFARIVNDIP